MTPSELRESCQKTLDILDNGTLGVILVIPKGGYPRDFPKGELLCSRVRNNQVENTYSFNPKKVIDWLDKKGL